MRDDGIEDRRVVGIHPAQRSQQPHGALARDRHCGLGLPARAQQLDGVAHRNPLRESEPLRRSAAAAATAATGALPLVRGLVHNQPRRAPRADTDRASLALAQRDAAGREQASHLDLVSCHRPPERCTLRCVIIHSILALSRAVNSVGSGAMDFPEQLAALRLDRGLTQAALADRAELNVSQLRRYENGTSEPTLAALRRLAVALSVSSDLLVFGEDGRLPEDHKLRLAFEASRFLEKRERETVTALLEAFLARHDNQDGHEGPRARRVRPTATASKSTRHR